MSTSMSSDPIITRESGRCQRKPFLNLWVWARESQLPISANQALGPVLMLDSGIRMGRTASAR